MPIQVDTSGIGGLARRLSLIEERLRVSSSVQRQAQAEIQEIVRNGHVSALRNGLDKDGNPVAPLKPSTLEYRHGMGPPRAPLRNSRPVVGLELRWDSQGEGRSVLVGSYRFPWMRYHDTGTRTRQGRIRMAARPMNGLTPETKRRIQDRIRQLGGDIYRP